VFRKLIRFSLYAHLLLASTVFAGELLDPTTPISLQNSVGSSLSKNLLPKNDVLSLDSIIKGPNSKIAIINGRRYRELDHVGEFMVSKINANSVVLNNGNEHLQLIILSAASSSLKGARSL
jgi:hypothetical protein